MVDHAALGAELYAALRSRAPVPCLRERVSGLTIEDAYRISEALLQLRLADGERLIGKKIGVTSPAVQDFLGVHQPDFGYLTDAMFFEDVIPLSDRLIQPKAEGEIAFRLKSDLRGPGVSPEDVLAATESVHACFEIVDSRIADWNIKICDTVADNASSGAFVIGPAVSPEGLDFAALRMRVSKNGAPLSEGLGAAALGSPLNCVAWLANTLGGFGVPLLAGEIILSGSLVPLEPVVAGDTMRAEVDELGAVEVRFS